MFGHAGYAMKKIFLLSLMFITAAPITAVIRVYDESGNVIETHEHKSDFREW
jgi:hypothetical protein